MIFSCNPTFRDCPPSSPQAVPQAEIRRGHRTRSRGGGELRRTPGTMWSPSPTLKTSALINNKQVQVSKEHLSVGACLAVLKFPCYFLDPGNTQLHFLSYSLN